MTKTKNYRLYYKKYYNIEFDKKYEVHHIDFNRDNNEISNLLLLPRELHQKYHNWLQEHCGVDNKNGIIELPTNSFSQWDLHYWSKTHEFEEIYYKVFSWYEYKLYLDGKMPNVNNIELR